MPNINPHLLKMLSKNYLFKEVERRKTAFLKTNPSIDLIDLGIGDVTKPLIPSVVEAICMATKEMETNIIGYGPATGYDFLKQAICDNNYQHLDISYDEIFISNGAKNDSSDIQELFSSSSRIAFSDPVYPVYVDANVIAGRSLGYCEKENRYKSFIYLPCLEENQFLPIPPDISCDLIYLCSPNNPTGIALTKDNLKLWVEYAKKHSSVIIYDSSYSAFITSKDIPHSIYEIDGAKEVAIEINSFSKIAGFTALRCSYCIIPKSIKHQSTPLHSLWKRRVESKSGGVSYPIQKGAFSICSKDGKKQINQLLSSYKENTKILRQGLIQKGYKIFGGIDSPYLWMKIPPNYSSWQFFDLLLEKTHIITIPGSGFGSSGEGFIRLSAFAKEETINRALKSIDML